MAEARSILGGHRPGAALSVYSVAKRIADVFISFASLFLNLPLLLLIGLTMWALGRKSPFYRQRRVGRFGKKFISYKFHTAPVGLDEVDEQFAMLLRIKSDSRRTRFGSFIHEHWIDEIPRLFSILLGHMSFIGPRPLTPDEADLLSQEEVARLSARPGLIYLREFSLASPLSFEEWKSLNQEYVETPSLKTDLRVLSLWLKPA